MFAGGADCFKCRVLYLSLQISTPEPKWVSPHHHPHPSPSSWEKTSAYNPCEDKACKINVCLLGTAKIVSSFVLCLISGISNSHDDGLSPEEERINVFYGNDQKSVVQLQWSLRIYLEACLALN